MNQPLGRAEPINNGGSASGITDFKKGEKLLGMSNCSGKEE